MRLLLLLLLIPNVAAASIGVSPANLDFNGHPLQLIVHNPTDQVMLVEFVAPLGLSIEGEQRISPNSRQAYLAIPGEELRAGILRIYSDTGTISPGILVPVTANRPPKTDYSYTPLKRDAPRVVQRTESDLSGYLVSASIVILGLVLYLVLGFFFRFLAS